MYLEQKKNGDLSIGGILKRNVASRANGFGDSPMKKILYWQNLLGANSGLAKTVALLAPPSIHPSKPLGMNFQISPLFHPFIKHSLGNGPTIRFSLDSRATPLSFSILFPPIYNLSLKKSSVFFRFLPSSNWNLYLRKNIRDDELPQFSSLLSILTHLHPTPSRSDSRFRSLASSGSFSVSSLSLSSTSLHLSPLNQFGIP